MQPLEHEGVFRGQVLSHAVGETKNGYPQWVVRLAVTEKYDEEEKQWEDWSEFGLAVDGYLVLFGEKGPCEIIKQGALQKATGWDAESFATLDALDLSETVVLFRTELDTYEGTTRLKVTSPTRELRKLDATQLATLDAKFGLKQAPAPVKAPTKAPAKPAAKKAKPATRPAAKKAKPATKAPAKVPAKPPARPGADGPEETDSKTWGDPEVSGQEAWGTVTQYSPEAEDDDRNAAWLRAVDEIAGADTDTDEVTPEQWASIRDAVLNNGGLPVIPF